MWLAELLADNLIASPTSFPNKEVGLAFGGGGESLSDPSDISSSYSLNALSNEDNHLKCSKITINSLDNTGSVRHGGLENYPDTGVIVGGHRSTPEQVSYARGLLVSCPMLQKRRHSWYCSRCDKTTSCSAWWTLRFEVNFFRASSEPFSLFVVENLIEPTSIL